MRFALMPIPKSRDSFERRSPVHTFSSATATCAIRDAVNGMSSKEPRGCPAVGPIQETTTEIECDERSVLGAPCIQVFRNGGQRDPLQDFALCPIRENSETDPIEQTAIAKKSYRLLCAFIWAVSNKVYFCAYCKQCGYPKCINVLHIDTCGRSWTSTANDIFSFGNGPRMNRVHSA